MLEASYWYSKLGSKSTYFQVGLPAFSSLSVLLITFPESEVFIAMGGEKAQNIRFLVG